MYIMYFITYYRGCYYCYCGYSNSLKRTPIWLTFVKKQLDTNPSFVCIRNDLYGFTEKS